MPPTAHEADACVQDLVRRAKGAADRAEKAAWLDLAIEWTAYAYSLRCRGVRAMSVPPFRPPGRV
jgi:hypothetical protein